MLYLNKVPTPIQLRYLQCPADEILFGGALGGGKSFASILDAYISGQKLKGLVIGLFRRTLNELTNTLIREALETYPNGSYRFREVKRRMTLLNGSELRFNFIDTDKDLMQYQGQEFDMIIMDEACNFTEYQLVRIKERLRSSKKGVRTKIRYLTNPIGVGKGYLKRRFIDGKEPFKIYISEETKGLPKEQQRTLCYIPARLTDNIHLYKNDPSYLNSLKELPSDIYEAMVNGSWDSKVGTFFPQFDYQKHTILAYNPSNKDQIFLSMDWGTNKPFAVYWAAMTPSNHIIIYREYYGSSGKSDEGINMTAKQVANEVKERSKYDYESGLQYKYMVLDSACWNRVGYGKTIYEIMQENLSFPIIRSHKDRVNGWENMKSWLEYDGNDHIFNHYYRKPWMQITRSCTYLIKQAQDAIYSDTRQGDMNDKMENHGVESIQYLLSSRPCPQIQDLPSEEADW